jgi:hypothetical protein
MWPTCSGFRIDRHEHAARPRRGEAGDDGFGAFVEEDADPLATVQPQADQARGDAGDLVVQLPVAEACLAGGEGRCVGGALGRGRDELMEERGVEHGSGM